MSGEGEMNGQISRGSSGSDWLAYIALEIASESDEETRPMEHQISIDKITKSIKKLPSDQHIQKNCISKVHSRLRSVNDKAYDPALVSIGPYHYKRRKTDLQYMETQKLRYVDDLIKRKKKIKGISKGKQLGEYFWILGKLEKTARDHYEEAFDLEKADFLEMLLVDACFIIELFQRAIWSCHDAERETDPLFKANWIIEGLKRDLILVENQIPFFVLKRLYLLVGDIPNPLALIFLAVRHLPINDQQPGEVAIASQSILDLCIPPFAKLPSPPSKLQRRRLDKSKLERFKHLLDLTRKFMLIEENLEIKDKSENLEIKDKSQSQQPDQEQPQSKDTSLTLADHKKDNSLTLANHKKYTYSATELRELGVTFRGVEKSKFYDIKFIKGVLEIPLFYIDDSTETLFRNLIAYEEHGHCQEETIYIGNYMTFMDGLIDTAKDVKLLRHYKIIDGYLGDDNKIAEMFNNMARNSILIMSYYYYGPIVQQIRDYCDNRNAHVWSHWTVMIKRALIRNFLNTPWRILSVIAAAVLLVLTLLQTVYSGLSYDKA